MLGHNSSDATGGTKRVCRMETRFNDTPREIYSHSIVSFVYEGRNYNIRFKK